MLRPVTGLFFLVVALVPLADARSAPAQRHRPGPSGEPPGPRSAAAEGRLGPGALVGRQKISNAEGGFPDTLESSEAFGGSVVALGDLDGNGIDELAVGATSNAQDGLNSTGAVWVLFLDAGGAVRAHQEINTIVGGFTGTLDMLDSFGCSLAALGDIDGVGVGDLGV